MRWYHTDEFPKENDELLYTVLVTHYDPQISCQRKGVKRLLLVPSVDAWEGAPLYQMKHYTDVND